MSRRSSISERRDDILESVKAAESPKRDEARQSRQRSLTQRGYYYMLERKLEFFAKETSAFRRAIYVMADDAKSDKSKLEIRYG